MDNKKIVIGRNPVLEYINTAISTNNIELIVSKNAHGKIVGTITNTAKKKNITITYKEKDYFKKIASSSKHQGIALIISSSSKKIDEKDILKSASQKNGVLILLDQITDPHNTGAIIRTAEALGCNGVIIPKAHSSSINPTVVKSSAGATAHIDIVTISNIASFLEKAKDNGFWIIGSSDHGEKSLSELSSIRPAVLIIGSEGKGMRHLTEEKCDFITKIPMKGKISSLNASVAAGILLYELMKN